MIDSTKRRAGLLSACGFAGLLSACDSSDSANHNSATADTARSHSGAVALAPPSDAIRQARTLIETEIARGTEATKNEDIDGYMHGIPEDYVIFDESGAVITREQMRANALRDWSVISRTLELTIVVDSLLLTSDSVATVYTSQRWERLMRRPDNSGEDTVLTTQVHRETWRRTPDGWRNYAIDELGGRIVINGTTYVPK